MLIFAERNPKSAIMSRINEAFDFESDTKNFKYPFGKMSQKYGKEFIELLRAMWEANGGCQTEEEFCAMNDMPKGFFEKQIKFKKSES